MSPGDAPHRLVLSGIDANLEPSDWEATDQAILDGIRRAADVLSEHFLLGHDNRDELPDHRIVRAE